MLTSRPAQLPIQWADGSCAVVDGIFYLVGGYTFGSYSGGSTPFTGMYSYDPQANRYSTLANPPNAHGRGSIAVAVNSKIYLIGGYPKSDTVDMYDTLTGTWISAASSPNGYTNGPVAAYNLDGDKKIHVFNGHPTLPLHDVYDPDRNSWTSLAAVPLSHTQFSTLGVRSDGKVILLGGIPPPADLKAMIYDHSRSAWTTANSAFPIDHNASMNGLTYGSPRENPVLGDTLFVIGGRRSTSARNFTSKCYAYDMLRDSYTEIPSFKSIPRDGICGTVYNNQLFIFGGRFATSIQTGSPCADVLTIHPRHNGSMYSWSPNQWNIKTIKFDDPKSSIPDQPFAKLPHTKEDYLYYWSAESSNPGEGGTVGRTYVLRNVSTNSIIERITIPPGIRSCNSGCVDKKLSQSGTDKIVLEVQSNDYVTAPRLVEHTIKILTLAK